MHFADEAKIHIKAGNGGDGMIAYRREKFIPKGGPNGGNGGNGGDVIFRLNPNLNTLSNYRSKKNWKAQNGEKGGTWQKNGKEGETLMLEVPEGTIIKETESGEILADISSKNPEYTVARGGKGGFGNAHFTSSTRQCPRFAEYGDKGEEIEVEMELKLIADIGIIGFPSVGKSTLISVISNVKPKIADYPFTTLVPNRGIVDFKGDSMLVCDTPGLIEGASEGKGLGHQFLRHIERTAGLIHLLDGSLSPEEIVQNYEAIRNELKIYSENLADKPEMIVVNKIDIVTEDERDSFEKELKKILGKDFIMISAGTKEGIENFLYKLFEFKETHIEKEPEAKEVGVHEEIDEDGNTFLAPDDFEGMTSASKRKIKVYKPHLENANLYRIEKLGRNTFRVHGKRIEQIARMTMWSIYEAVERVYDVMDKRGMLKELKKAGATPGNKVYIDKFEIEYRD